MKAVLLMVAAATVVLVMASPGAASAKGCLKGAAVGGVAGHVAGHHGLIGAAAGCAIEHHREIVRDRNAAHPSVPAQSQGVPSTQSGSQTDTNISNPSTK